MLHHRIRLWDKHSPTGHCLYLIVSLELIAPGTLKFSLNNASANTSLTALPKMQAQRFWIERTVQDAKSHIGVAQ